MAIFKALTFDGVNSLDYGIYITGEAVYNAPERAVEMVNIPGKNGALALDQGRFENIEVTYHAGCFADNQADFADKVMKFRNALASRYTYKRLTDEYHSDEYRLGLYKSGLDVDAVRYGTAGEFNIVFDCKPQRFLVDGDRAISPTEWHDVQTKSGELVTIDSDGSLAVKSLSVSLSPIQDLNGYDKPWAGGNGKNMFDRESAVAGYLDSNGTVLEASPVQLEVTSDYIRITPSTAYIFSVNVNTSETKWVGIGLYDENKGFITRLGGHKKTGPRFDLALTTTQTANVYYVRISYRTYGIDTEAQFELGSTATSYEPYSNICPISGRTEVVTQRTGKNLLDYDAMSSGYINIYGEVSPASPTQLEKVSGFIPITAGQAYTFSTIINNAYRKWVGIGIYDAEKKFIGRPTSGEMGSITDITYALPSLYTTGASYVRVSFRTYGIATNVQFEEGTEKTEYDGYAQTYTTDLGRTVYGGTLDVVSGVLTVTHAIRTFDGTEDWRSPDGSGICWFRDDTLKKTSNYEGTIIASTMPTARTRRQLRDDFECGISGYEASGADNYWYIKAPNQTTQTNVALKAWLQANNAQVCYELATPQTYQLTPQQIDLLLGTNHLWSDGEITVEYGVRPYYNPTPFESKPLIKVTGRGTLGIGEYILTITGTTSQTLYIDCETMEIYTIEGTVPMGASSLVSINKLDFPVLKPGMNNISVGSGITAVTITPRWWRI